MRKLKYGDRCKYVHEIINTYFGKSYKAWMKAVYRLDDKYQAWFGTINRDKNGNFKMVPSCNWMNEVYDNKIIMWAYSRDVKDKDDVEKGEKYKTLIFAKDGTPDYMFYGVYENKVTYKDGKTIITHKLINKDWQT